MSTGSASESSRPGSGFVDRLLLLGLDAYRATLAPLIGGFCAYYPSCSVYAEEAVRRHGALLGTRLALRRLLRCHPFCRGGYDPVPEERPDGR